MRTWSPVALRALRMLQTLICVVFFQMWNPETCVPFPWTPGHVTEKSGGLRTTLSPRGARASSTAAVGGMKTTLFSAKTALPSAKAERVCLQDQWQKCAFHCFLMEESEYVCLIFFRWSSREDHPYKEEKHRLHTKPLNLKAKNLFSHLYLCLFFWVYCIVFIATMLSHVFASAIWSFLLFLYISMTKNEYVLL